MDTNIINKQVNYFIENLEEILEIDDFTPEEKLDVRALVIENIQITLENLKIIVEEVL